MNLAEGAVLDGRFQLEALLGEGGMGTVWSARHVVTGKRVALKVLKVTSPELHRRLIREARVAAAVRHPNLVDVHDVLEVEGSQPVLVMDLLEGETLASLLAIRGRLDPASMGEILLPVVSAVSAAHAAGVIHRDLKPDNVFLSSDASAGERVKVLDFGIAKLTRELGSLRHTAPALTQTGSVLGTPTYMAPEQVFGERDIDHRADVWSIGIMIYECLAGRCPTDAENVGQIFKIISQRGFAPLARERPDLPTELTGLVDRMLSIRVHERPSLREVAVVLSAQAGLPCPDLPMPAGANRDSGPAGPPSIAHDETLAAAPDRGARRARWWLMATAILVSGAALGWMWSASGAERESAPAPARSSATIQAPLAEPIAAPSSSGPALAASEPSPSGSIAQEMRSTPRKIAIPAPSADRAVKPTLPGGVHADSPY